MTNNIDTSSSGAGASSSSTGVPARDPKEQPTTAGHSQHHKVNASDLETENDEYWRDLRTANPSEVDTASARNYILEKSGGSSGPNKAFEDHLAKTRYPGSIAWAVVDGIVSQH